MNHQKDSLAGAPGHRATIHPSQMQVKLIDIQKGDPSIKANKKKTKSGIQKKSSASKKRKSS